MSDRITVSRDLADRRLDRILRTIFKDVPLGQIMKSIRTGAVRVDGKRTKADYRADVGSIIDVPWARDIGQQAHEVRKMPSPKLDIIYQDPDVIVIDKPAGVLSQPSEKGGRSAITDIWSYLGWTITDFRPALLGRLDRNVSGVMIAALNAPTLRCLSELIRSGRVTKTYIAVVIGEIDDCGEINVSLKKDPDKNISYPARDGERALTVYRRLSTNGSYSLVELDLITGRHHQLRAHLSHISHPIAGDAKYGGRKDRRDHGRDRGIALHAYSIALPEDALDLPEAVRGMRFAAPVPDRIKRQYSELF